jgi:hypothetical protein
VGANEDLEDDWARANRAGRAVNRRKAFATLVSIGATAALAGAGYLAFFALWPSERFPVLFLALPWLPALPVGWWVRNGLWPRGALGR